jgi:RHS repeat-associated protein
VTYAYGAFGAIRLQSDFSANYFKFTGEQRDSESGFDYLRARYYDPEVGRFPGQDPAGEGMNFYTYADSNPVNNTDPTGLAMWIQPWEDATYADTWMFYMFQVQLEASYVSESNAIDEGLYESFVGTAAGAIILINGPLERCYDGFASCSTRNGYELVWRPNPDPDPIALRVCHVMNGSGSCMQAERCVPQNCQPVWESEATDMCTSRYCCSDQCAPTHPWNTAPGNKILRDCDIGGYFALAGWFVFGGPVAGVVAFGCATGIAGGQL